MNTATRFSTIAAAAVLAWGLWCAGIAWFNGSNGLNWLRGFHWGAIPLCIAIAAACAAAVARHSEPVRLSLFVFLASAMCFAAFAAGRAELYQMFGGVYAMADLAPPLRLGLYAIAMSVGLPWLASRLLAPLHGWTALLVMAAFMLAVLLAGITVTCFPGERHADPYNAIRLGYPVFWTALLLPSALWGGVKR